MNPSRYRWLCTFLLAGFLPSPAPAQELQEIQELGPLFFTPERRQELDRQRQFKFREHQDIPDEDRTLSINGAVTRSGGQRTVWINGIAQEPLAPNLPNHGNPGTVIIQTEDGTASARVGDTVNRNTGETSGLLDGGWIHIKTTPPK